MKGLILLAVLWLVGCSDSLGMTPQVEPADDHGLPVTEAEPAVLAPDLTGTALSETHSNSVATIESTRFPSGTRIEPLITSSGQLIALGWSPNGEWFAYRDLSTSYDYLYDLVSGDTCPLAEMPPLLMQQMTHSDWEWLADNRLLVILPDRVIITEPCAESEQDISTVFTTHPMGIASANADHNLLVLYSIRDEYFCSWYLYDALDGSLWAMPPDVGGLNTGFSWSPGSTYLAIMALTNPMKPHQGRVWVMDVTSGNIARVIDMDLWVQDAPYLGPPWISDTQFVVPRTLDRGPLLVTIGGGITLIPEQIFGAKMQNEECSKEACLMHTFVRTAGTSDAGQHLMWEIWYAGYDRQIYHAETGEIEAVDFTGDVSFSPDGQWMLIWNREEQSLYLRAIDPPGAPLVPLLFEGEVNPKWSFNPFKWSPDSETFAVTVEAGQYVALYSVPDAHEAGRWWADDYTLGSPGLWSPSYEWATPGVWSPDGKYLLLTGSGAGSALFLIQRS
ncbi:MAG: hypothetical protein JXB07_18325 [Anaerolineae bacterium]|nr:hypothetical protein [Anaerolineae bacterium]